MAPDDSKAAVPAPLLPVVRQPDNSDKVLLLVAFYLSLQAKHRADNMMLELEAEAARREVRDTEFRLLNNSIALAVRAVSLRRRRRRLQRRKLSL